MNKINDRADNAPDTKFHLVEYIKECSKEQQQILSTDIRKNQKILDVPVKRKKDTFTESSLVTLEMKDSYKKLETSTIELTKFRSNTDEISTAGIQGEIIIIGRRKKTKKKSSILTFCSIKKDKNNECIGDNINIQINRQTCSHIAKTPGQMNRYMVADNSYSNNSHEDSDNESKSTNKSSLCSSFISFNSNVTLEPQLEESNHSKVIILTISDKIVSNAIKISRAKDLTIEKHNIINKPLNKNFHRSNRDNSFSTKLTCHDIPITSKKKIVCSNIIKGSNDHIILTKKGWEENNVIRNKEKQSTIYNVEQNNKIFMHSHKCKSNTNTTSASTNFLAINKSCYNESVCIRYSTSDKSLLTLNVIIYSALQVAF